MNKLNKYILVWSLLLFFSCNSMKTVSLYDTVENKVKEDPFLSFVIAVASTIKSL